MNLNLNSPNKGVQVMPLSYKAFNNFDPHFFEYLFIYEPIWHYCIKLKLLAERNGNA